MTAPAHASDPARPLGAGHAADQWPGSDAASGSPPGFAVEPTAIGPQSLVPGVIPITPRDRLAWRAAAPMEPKKRQRACDHGLFDLNARNQLDLFQRPHPSFDPPHGSDPDAAPAKAL
ncbi:hypothetical protein EAH79_02375 [Sphingomonas koreensis]|nr:hypothetical protein EAH79_02375 [Sphingomonas koreensis]